MKRKNRIFVKEKIKPKLFLFLIEISHFIFFVLNVLYITMKRKKKHLSKKNYLLLLIKFEEKKIKKYFFLLTNIMNKKRREIVYKTIDDVL